MLPPVPFMAQHGRAPVAQLNRASVYGTESRWFESRARGWSLIGYAIIAIERNCGVGLVPNVEQAAAFAVRGPAPPDDGVRQGQGGPWAPAGKDPIVARDVPARNTGRARDDVL